MVEKFNFCLYSMTNWTSRIKTRLDPRLRQEPVFHYWSNLIHSILLNISSLESAPSPTTGTSRFSVNHLHPWIISLICQKCLFSLLYVISCLNHYYPGSWLAKSLECFYHNASIKHDSVWNILHWLFDLFRNLIIVNCIVFGKRNKRLNFQSIETSPALSSIFCPPQPPPLTAALTSL